MVFAKEIGRFLVGVVVVCLAGLGVFSLVSAGHILPADKWRCAMVKPATKVGERAECVVYVDVRVARQAKKPPAGTPL